MIQFANLHFAWLIFLPIIVDFWLPTAKKMSGDALRVPFLQDIEQIKSQSNRLTILNKFNVVGGLKLFIMSLIWVLMVGAICRPQWVGEPLKVKNEGRDILLVVDISNSMSERDFVLGKKVFDRLTAVKNVVSQFIDKRLDDRIGLVLF